MATCATFPIPFLSQIMIVVVVIDIADMLYGIMQSLMTAGSGPGPRS